MKEYRVQRIWLWLITMIGPPLALAFIAIAVLTVFASDANPTQTLAQKSLTSLICVFLGLAMAYAPWTAWTARLWLNDTGIRFKYGFRTHEIHKEQIRSYSLRPGVRMVAMPLMPGFIELYGTDKKKIASIPGYFEGRAELLAWLNKVVSG
ncbi:hypothetical protein [Granulicella mallensis]|uniref:Uncharacterized protein n=1 Tax=Granulicella mallensis (strain ATCC BAA-1857 / DSM 23137 / MP5ACTX8) TaxID=682795 RepID=G8NU08_GRAMM|nr:hypothetical protein [Granulicella mallensis]AEU37564.1 hypothetical protein AciX8_3264 [Granulicella mallensis MP5ACTX8]